MAPEVIDGNHYDGKADVYSFGILMYQIVTDSRPYPLFDKGQIKEFRHNQKIVDEDYRPTEILTQKVTNMEKLIEKIKDDFISEQNERINKLEMLVQKQKEQIKKQEKEIQNQKEQIVKQNIESQNQIQKLNRQIIELNKQVKEMNGWLQFDLKEWKLKIIWKKDSFRLNEPLCYPEKEKEKAEIKYDEEYIIEGERYKLKERGGPIKGPIFEKISSSNSPTPPQSSQNDINDLKNKNNQQEKIINDLKNKNNEQEKAINDLKTKNNEQEKTLKNQGKQIEQLQEQLAQVMQFIQKGMLPTSTSTENDKK